LEQRELVAFWVNLKAGFDLFEKDHRLRNVLVAKDGRYEFSLESAGGTGH
jgi:murein L,D-transpeptidase YafK